MQQELDVQGTVRHWRVTGICTLVLNVICLRGGKQQGTQLSGKCKGSFAQMHKSELRAISIDSTATRRCWTRDLGDYCSGPTGVKQLLHDARNHLSMQRQDILFCILSAREPVSASGPTLAPGTALPCGSCSKLLSFWGAVRLDHEMASP